MGNESNITSDPFLTICFYIVSAIVAIGSVIQLFLMLPLGSKFYLFFVKRYVPLYIIMIILQFLSIVYFPVVSFYVFIKLYANKSKTIF